MCDSKSNTKTPYPCDMKGDHKMHSHKWIEIINGIEVEYYTWWE